MSLTDRELLARALRFYEGCPDGQYDELVVKIIRERLGQQPAQQEPAFYGFMREEECCVNICYTPWAPGGPNNELPTAYYTSPHPAQRKPLTDAQINAFFEGMEPNNGFWLSFARAIEAAHGVN